MSAPQRRFVCQSCGDVIGVYERLITVTDAGPRTTSIASEPALSPLGHHFHLHCFDQDEIATEGGE